jgi:hypothetical protein
MLDCFLQTVALPDVTEEDKHLKCGKRDHETNYSFNEKADNEMLEVSQFPNLKACSRNCHFFIKANVLSLKSLYPF